MDRGELVAQLSGLGLDDAEYLVPGFHDLPGSPEEYYYLRPAGDGWEVGVHERGADHPHATFATEHDACLHLHGLLAGRLGRGAESISIEELQARGEESRRIAREQLRRSSPNPPTDR